MVVRQRLVYESKNVSDWVVQRMPAGDRTHFMEMLANELAGLHEGNIARFRLRPSEFAEWKKGKANDASD